MFKLTQTNGIQRLADGAFLPCRFENGQVVALDEHSPFVAEFRKWIAAGNTPQAADPQPTPLDESDLANIQKHIKAAVLAAAIMSGKTPVQARAAFKTAWDSLN